MLWTPTQKVTTCLWYDNKALEAAELYTSLFPDSKILSKSRMMVKFTLNGQEILGLNGGPMYKHTPAASLYVSCDDQEEIDRLWEALTKDGGKEVKCGWVEDKFGVSWQIVPKILPALTNDPDQEKMTRAFQAMMKMVKLDIAELEKAHAGTA